MSDPVAAADELETIWAPGRIGLTLAVNLPGIAVSAGVTGLLVSTVGPAGVAVTTALVTGVVVTMVRLVLWVFVTGRRVVAASDTHLAVRSRGRTLVELPWSEMRSVRLVPGDGLLRTALDVTSGDATFPSVFAQPADVWDVRGLYPSLLAVLPAEVRRLEAALAEACAARSVPFDVRPL